MRSNPQRVAIIGAGLGGIAAAVHLKRDGVPFTVFEQSAGPGGTWWDNTYPGCECDVPIVFYAYSFRAHPWTRTHASQREIQSYVQAVIEAYDLGPHLRFNTRVVEAVWDDQNHIYTLVLDDGSRERFEVVVAALGLLNVPRYPTWPGLERFRGPKFHTARWEHNHTLAGRTVAVVGAGSTAAQVVPAVAPLAGKVLMFVREPAYVMPKGERALTEKERARYNTRWGRWLERTKMFINVERRMSVRNPHSRRQRDARASFLRYRDEMFRDRPDLQDITTPDYPVACKRPVSASDLFPALTRDNVQLVPRGVTSVTENGVVDSDGVEHPADVLVMATGFQPWSFLGTLKLFGRAGRSIHGVWGDEPEAFLGMQIAGFPNFFMMYGPNTNYMCVTFILERQAEYIARTLRRMNRCNATAVDVRRVVMDVYNRAVGRALARKTLAGECHNYYHTASGKNVVTWPWRGIVYIIAARLGWLACTMRRADAEPKPAHLELERSTVLGDQLRHTQPSR